MKNVLLLAYYFPPLLGTKRAWKISKYLPDFCWRPYVITTRDRLIQSDEESLLDVPHEVKIYRTMNVQPRHIIDGLFSLIGLSSQGKTGQFFRYMVSIPDAELSWSLMTLWTGLRLMRTKKIDLIYTTSPPASIHAAGYLLKRLTGKPWVADFRDAWTENKYFHRYSSENQKQVEEFLEAKVLKSADRIISVSEPITQALATKYPGLNPAKFITITNGFDPSEVRQVNKKREEDSPRFTMVYTGSLDEWRNPVYFLRAMDELLNEQPSFRDRIRVIFIGHYPEYVGMLAEYKTRLGREVLIAYEYRPYRECLRFMNDADLLLFFFGGDAGQMSGMYSGKIFEYLAAQKPLLALIPEGVAADLIREVNAGTVVQPQNITGIKQALQSFITRHNSGTLSGTTTREKLQKYEWKNLTGELAGVFNELTDH